MQERYPLTHLVQTMCCGPLSEILYPIIKVWEKSNLEQKRQIAQFIFLQGMTLTIRYFYNSQSMDKGIVQTLSIQKSLKFALLTRSSLMLETQDQYVKAKTFKYLAHRYLEYLLMMLSGVRFAEFLEDQMQLLTVHLIIQIVWIQYIHLDQVILLTAKLNWF